jgi:transposase, IS30 family
MMYKQLTLEERYQIYGFLRIGMTLIEIAKALGVHKSTISREIKRNKGKRGYRPKQAEEKRKERLKKRKTRISQKEWAMIERYLKEDYSPEQVSNWMKKEYDLQVSHEWIYQHIYEDKKEGGTIYKHLRRRKKYRHRGGKRDHRGIIPNRRSIEDRPEIVERRERIGDWEVDTIIGERKKGAIVTLVDRKSRYLRMGLVPNRTKNVVADMIISLLKDLPVHTITCDNGKEFADHERIAAALNTDVYFAHPYSSYERGTNENTNGLIRQYIPKDTDFRILSVLDIVFVERRLNTRPRKCISFDQPMVFLNNSCCTL